MTAHRAGSYEEHSEKTFAPYAPGADEDKIPQAVVLYMPPDVLNGTYAGEKIGARCGKCMMFIKDLSNCAILKPAKVSGPNGVCGLYVNGEPVSSEDHKAMKLVPKEVAGYYEGEGAPTHCGNCKYFIEKREACKEVAGHIEAEGCCNNWEHKESEKEEDLTEANPGRKY